MSKDPLKAFVGISACPNCGCLDHVGTYRCAECGVFHAGTTAAFEEREAPPPSALPEKPIADPSAYSLSGSSKPVEEKFEESEEVTTWRSASSDFSFDDEDEPPLAIEKKDVQLPEPEELD